MKNLLSYKTAAILLGVAGTLLSAGLLFKSPVVAQVGLAVLLIDAGFCLVRMVSGKDMFETEEAFEARLSAHRAADEAELEQFKKAAIANMRDDAEKVYRTAFSRGYEAGRTAQLGADIRAFNDPNRVPLDIDVESEELTKQ